MKLPKEMLLSYGAQVVFYKKGEFLFRKNDYAHYYFQVLEGAIKMNNYSGNGREFIQGIFKEGKSFGEPPLFIDKKYPSNAQALKDSKVLKLSKHNFLELIDNNKKGIEVLRIFAKRLYYKAIIAVEMSSEKAEHRILRLLDYFKEDADSTIKDKGLYKFNFTRQEIANLTGLRTETVIRAVKVLKTRGDIQVIDRKIYR